MNGSKKGQNPSKTPARLFDLIFLKIKFQNLKIKFQNLLRSTNKYLQIKQIIIIPPSSVMIAQPQTTAH